MPSPISTTEISLEIELEVIEVTYRYSGSESQHFDRGQEQWYPGSNAEVDIDSVHCLIRLGEEYVDIGPWLKQCYLEKIEKLVSQQVEEEV